MSNEAEILALEERRYAAQIACDLPALESLFDERLIYTHSSAVVDTKASFIDALRSGKTKYKRASRSDVKVRFAGDAALVTGGAELDVEIGGEPRQLKLRFLNVWAKTPAGWKFLAWQSTRLP